MFIILVLVLFCDSYNLKLRHSVFVFLDKCSVSPLSLSLSLSHIHTHTNTDWIHLLNLIFVLWCAVRVWILLKFTQQTLGHTALYTSKSLPHTLLTLGHIAFVLYTHTVSNKADTHGPLALGQSCLSAAVCRLSLFPCPVGAPVPPPHWAPALGAAVKRVVTTPLRGGGWPDPHHPAPDAP